MFHRTIADNIRFGRPAASDADVRRAASLAGTRSAGRSSLLAAFPVEAVGAQNAGYIEREDARHVRVVLSLPGGSRARLMGEMTGWRPVDLEPIGGGRFVGSFLAVPGTYRINVALDDGPWVAPPGMPRIEDGFGGMVGLLEL